MPSRLRHRAVAPVLASVLAVGCTGAGAGDGDGQAGASAERGQELFANNCAACHGEGGTGTTTGPPLVHEIYEPSHHGDESFHRAVEQGVQAHHWDLGPMAPLPGLERSDVEDTIAYVRSEQRAAGIS